MIPVLIACGSSAPTPQAPSPNDPPGPMAMGDTGHKVDVQSTGAGPRQRLRYRFAKGANERLDMDLAMTTTMVFDDPVMGGNNTNNELPTIRTRIRMEVRDVKPNGNATLEFGYEESRVAPEAQVDETMRKTIDEAIKGYVGMRGRLEMNARGAVLDVDLKPPPGANPTIVGSLEQMRDSMRTMYVPFPDEAVGVGARWTFVYKAKARGIENTTTYHYKLLEISERHARLALEIHQVADKQDLDVGVAGMKGTLLTLASTGQGNLLTSPTSLAPTANIGMSTKYSFTINDGTNEMKVNAGMQMTMSTRPAR